VVDWRVEAETERARAERAESVVKAGLVGHLARYLRDRLVAGLVWQRRRLVEDQEEGNRRTQDLEQRLALAQERLKERMGAYETRLRELESVEGGESVGSAGGGASSGEGRRRNPLVQRAVVSEPEPVKFQDILARRRAGEAVREAPRGLDGSRGRLRGEEE